MIILAMTFNLWHGGEAGGLPLEQTAQVILHAGADLVGLQETIGHTGASAARWLAERLGWSVVEHGRTAIMSRFPLEPQPWGAIHTLPNGIRLAHANVHLAHAPYQPYQLFGIEYCGGAFLKTPEEAIAAARVARGAQIGEVLAALPFDLPCVLTGDFNEPSHRDWPDVHWPTTQAVEDAGFVDAFRAIYPDAHAVPGYTWTPLTPPDDPTDHHDRIDFVFVRKAQVQTARIVGEHDITPYPSDHRAVACGMTIHQ